MNLEEIVTLPILNFDSGHEMNVTAPLAHFLRNPAGIKMEHLGLVMFNEARRQLGLSTYVFNKETGTFDEVS